MKTEIIKSFIKKNNVKISDIKTIYELVNSIDSELLEKLDENILDKYYKMVILKDKPENIDSKDIGNADLENEEPNIYSSIPDYIMKYINSPKMLKFSINPKYVIKKAYIYLDSMHRLRNNDLSIMKWNINTQDIYNENDAITSNKIKNIISMELFPFIMPSTWFLLSNSNRLYVSIIELLSKAYVQYKTRFHFEYYLEYKPITFPDSTGYRVNYDMLGSISNDIINNISTSDIRIRANEIGNNKNIFYFDEPINELNTISMEFSNGLEKLILDCDGIDEPSTQADTAFIINSNYYSYYADGYIVQGQKVTAQIYTMSSLHVTIIGITLGYKVYGITNSRIQFIENTRIYFLDYTTDYPDNPEHKKIIDMVNRPEGWQLLYIGIAAYIEIDIYWTLKDIPTGYNPSQDTHAVKSFKSVITSKQLKMRLELNYLDLE
jgi:hypothetical protein